MKFLAAFTIALLTSSFSSAGQIDFAIRCEVYENAELVHTLVVGQLSPTQYVYQEGKVLESDVGVHAGLQDNKIEMHIGNGIGAAMGLDEDVTYKTDAVIAHDLDHALIAVEKAVMIRCRGDKFAIEN